MSLKNLLKKLFGETQKISGGNGKSLDDAIVIHKTGHKSFVETEHEILKKKLEGKKKIFITIAYIGSIHSNKRWDEISITTFEDTENGEVIKEERYFFDVTEFYNNTVHQDKSIDKNRKFKQMKENIISFYNRVFRRNS